MEQFEKEIKGYNLQKAINVDTGFGLPIEETIKGKTSVDLDFEAIVIAFHKGLVSEEVLEKARSGIYKDNPVNRKAGKAGTRYGNAVNGGQVHDLENGEKFEHGKTYRHSGLPGAHKYNAKTDEFTHTWQGRSWTGKGSEKYRSELKSHGQKKEEKKGSEKKEDLTGFKQDHPTKDRGNSELNYVAAIHNVMGWGRAQFIDPVAGGYRIRLGDSKYWDEVAQKKLIEKIKKEEPSIPVDKIKFRKRGGFGPAAGSIDMIIPRANEQKVILSYKK